MVADIIFFAGGFAMLDFALGQWLPIQHPKSSDDGDGGDVPFELLAGFFCHCRCGCGSTATGTSWCPPSGACSSSAARGTTGSS
jgi:hypothetical protein